MRTRSHLLAWLGAFLLGSCGGGTADQEAATLDSLAMDTLPEVSYIMDLAASKVDWSATMIGVKTHSGRIGFTRGLLVTKGGLLVGGKFTVDMTKIALTDTNYAPDGAEQGTKADLTGHLRSNEFFAVDSFPTASFMISEVKGNTATGDLNVRGRTHTETVTDIVLEPFEGGLRATGKLTFDRQKYGVSWSSGMQDMVVSDDVVLNVDVSARAR